MPDEADDQVAQHRYYEVQVKQYEALKREQDRRMNTRDTIPYWTLGIVLVLAGAGLNTPAVLLAIAPACAILGWTRIGNDYKVTQIGRHIATTTAPQLKELCGGRDVLEWETSHRITRRRSTTKLISAAFELLLFVAPGLIAVTALAQTSRSWAYAGGCILDLAIAALIAWQIGVHADLNPNRR